MRLRISKTLGLVALLLMLGARCASASAAFDAVGHGSTSAAGTSIPNFTITLVGNSNMAVGVGIALTVKTIDLTGLTVTVGGVTATYVTGTDTGNTGGWNDRAALYVAILGSSTGAQTVSISWPTTSASGAAVAISATGVDQTTPCNNGTSASIVSTGSTSFSITSTSGDLTWDFAQDDSGAASEPDTPLKTQVTGGPFRGADFQTAFSASYGDGTGTQTHGWHSASGMENPGANFKAASAGGTCTPTMLLLGVGRCGD